MSDGKYGVLLVNLGTPSEPTYWAVRRFLRDFLSDVRVVDVPRLIWLPLLYGIILTLRPLKVSKNYQKIWSDEGSPLFVNALNQKKRLQTLFDASVGSGSVKVDLAMTYGEPAIAESLCRLKDWGAKRLIVLPLYPQYSRTTTAAVTDQIALLTGKKHQAERPGFNQLSFDGAKISVINDYHDSVFYIKALASSIKPKLRPGVKLILSFHGIPKRYVAQGDPYQAQCEVTAKRLAMELNLTEAQWEMAYQSRVGREEWLRPYLDQRMSELPGEGTKNIAVVCPGFSSDCLETLEEIAMESKALFLESGGESFQYIEALNASRAHIEMMADLVRRKLDLESSRLIK